MVQPETMLVIAVAAIIGIAIGFFIGKRKKKKKEKPMRDVLNNPELLVQKLNEGKPVDAGVKLKYGIEEKDGKKEVTLKKETIEPPKKLCLICEKESKGDVCSQGCLDEWHRREEEKRKPVEEIEDLEEQELEKETTEEPQEIPKDESKDIIDQEIDKAIEEAEKKDLKTNQT